MTTLVVRAERQLGRGLRVLLLLAFFGVLGLLFAGSVPWLYRAAAIAVFAGGLWLARWAYPASFAAPRAVTEIDEKGVRRMAGSRQLEGLRWDRLVRVSIVTTDEGPWLEDFIWLLHADDGSGVAIGQAQATEVDLLGRLQRLSGFDNEAVIRASGCTENAEFVCWQGQPGAASIAGANAAST